MHTSLLDNDRRYADKFLKVLHENFDTRRKPESLTNQLFECQHIALLISGNITNTVRKYVGFFFVDVVV